MRNSISMSALLALTALIPAARAADKDFNGRWDLIAELRAESLEAFDRALGNIRLIDGIASTETSLLLSTHKV